MIIENNIIKSSIDKRKYDFFTLDNKMKVFIINDPSTEINCVALSVSVGYMHDTIPGIAHFLEHMLFMGSDKYEDEGLFQKYITSHGGLTNAYTAHDHTCYYFTIQHNAFKTALHMFSYFFINALLKQDVVDREIIAVSSEHDKNKNDDNWRSSDLLRYVTISDHGFAKFGTGNEKTLRIKNIHKHVKDFYDNYYSSDKMTLIILTKDNIDSTKKMIHEMFSEVKLKNDNMINSRINGDILHSKKMIQMVPQQDKNILNIYWNTLSFKDSPNCNPKYFLMHLLGHEGHKSLNESLINLGLISNMFCGEVDIVNDRSIFTMSFELTPDGQNKLDLIMHYMYNYINIIKKSVDSKHMNDLYNEYKKFNILDFEYDHEMSAEQYVLYLIRKIQSYDLKPTDYLIYPASINEYEKIKENLILMIDSLNFNNSIIMNISREHKNKTTSTAEYYGTEFNIIDFNYHKNNDIELQELLSLPILNKYVPTNVNLIADNEVTIIPQQILSDKIISFYVSNKKISDVPKIRITAYIDVPIMMTNSKVNVACFVYIASIIGMINSELYMCNTAGYYIDIHFKDNKLCISVYGYSDKIYDVCEFLVTSLINSNINNTIFESAQWFRKTADINEQFMAPYGRINILFKKKTIKKYYDYYDRLEIIDDITKYDCIESFKYILTYTNVTLLIAGNVTKELAVKITRLFENFASNNKYKLSILDEDIMKDIVTNEKILKHYSENGNEHNNAVGYYIFLDKIKAGFTENWNINLCLNNILHSIIGDKYFDQLRTKEGFGYVVNGSYLKFGDERFISTYYRFLVQSSEKTCDMIINRTEKFIKELINDLINISEDEYKRIINSQIVILNNPLKSINEMTEYYMSQIMNKYWSFNIKEVLIETYKNITKDHIISYFKHKFINNLKHVIISISPKK